ncbi:hypothetical protein CCHR01_03957 [Colletotrichum chrysophilum]|uniref:Fungal N-terminal domain-containing protein n=1 Tax=Colletotrichum chrysophilum TaxID=1836956 RepID=A0AAD9ARX6_9PEZI|nr:hypothetical protein CCHR01_03957 [Colletotrichum chrysophilum]
MGDSNALSLTANIAGVIGLADVVFRNGKELYDLYSRCRNAPAAKAFLLAELLASTSTIAQARIYLDDHQNSTLTATDGHSFPDVKTILTLFGQEFDLLCNMINDSRATFRGGWFNQLTKNFRWAIEEQTIAQSCNRLHRLTNSMIAALSVSGRQNDLVVRKELHVTKIEVIKLTETTRNIQAAMNSMSITPFTCNRAELNHHVPPRLPGLGRGADRGRRRNPRHKNNMIMAIRKSENSPDGSNQAKVCGGLLDNVPSGSKKDITLNCCEAKDLSEHDNDEDQVTIPVSDNLTCSAVYLRYPKESIYVRKTWDEFQYPAPLDIMCSTHMLSNSFNCVGLRELAEI